MDTCVTSYSGILGARAAMTTRICSATGCLGEKGAHLHFLTLFLNKKEQKYVEQKQRDELTPFHLSKHR